MRLQAAFHVSAPPDRVFAYLAIPSNLAFQSHEVPTSEASAGPTAVGSWATLALHQLRSRVEYTAHDPSRHIRARATFSGRGSFGRETQLDFHLEPGPGGGTTVRVDMESNAGWLGRVIAPVLWPFDRRRMSRLIEAGA